MIALYLALAISFIAIAATTFIIRNLLIKIERMEDELKVLSSEAILKDEFIFTLLEKTKESYDQMKQVDYMGSFEADDEVGTIFRNIKQVIDQLNNYIKQNIVNYDNEDSGTKKK
jgi:hypothetical protein